MCEKSQTVRKLPMSDVVGNSLVRATCLTDTPGEPVGILESSMRGIFELVPSAREALSNAMALIVSGVRAWLLDIAGLVSASGALVVSEEPPPPQAEIKVVKVIVNASPALQWKEIRSSNRTLTGPDGRNGEGVEVNM